MLARNQLGRLAYSLHDHVDVEPLNYVYDAPWIFGRTSVGSKLIALAHNHWCAFEVDEVGGLFDWQSVVVKGPFYALNSELGKAEEYDRAVAAFQRLSPSAFTDNDPAPHRTVVWGVHASEIEGRSAASDGALAVNANLSPPPMTAIAAVIGALILLAFVYRCLNILREYERAVVFRLGRVRKTEKGPGLIAIIWPIDRLVRVSLRVVTWDVPPQDVITRDNVSLKVNAVVYFRVTDANKAIVEVENYRYAVEQAAQTGLRSVLGEVELDDLLAQREKVNSRLQTILDEHTEEWGVKVTHVQVKQVDLPQEMQRAIAAQAEAERTRRAKVIAAEGEFQASAKLAEAAAVLNREPISVTLRYLQTLIEIGVEQNTTIIFPLPLDLLGGLQGKWSAPAAANEPALKAPDSTRGRDAIHRERKHVGPVIVARDVERHALFSHAIQIEVRVEHGRLVVHRASQVGAVGTDDRTAAAHDPLIRIGHSVGVRR